jgi:hypothetical protein
MPVYGTLFLITWPWLPLPIHTCEIPSTIYPTPIRAELDHDSLIWHVPLRSLCGLL